MKRIEWGSGADILSALIAVVALVLAIAGLVVGVWQHNQLVDLERQINLDPGELIIHVPTEFCVTRGFRAFPSDHLIIPVNFENTGNGAKTVERPALFFEDTTSGKQYTFELEGYIPNLDTYSIDGAFEIARGITVPERSLSRYVLVFQIERWWDKDSDNYLFQFRRTDDGPTRYDMRFGYYEIGNTTPVYWADGDRSIFLSMPLYEAMNNLELKATLRDRLSQDSRYEDFLKAQLIGTYNTDCYTHADFPAYPTE